MEDRLPLPLLLLAALAETLTEGEPLGGMVVVREGLPVALGGREAAEEAL